MNKALIECRINEIDKLSGTSDFAFATPEIADHVHTFHCSLPNYAPTPLVNLTSLAGHLGVGEILVKDESHRFDLNAFKVLGASFAMAKQLGDMLKLDHNELTYGKILSELSNYKDLTFVTATDGNHGRAVAWSAELFGRKAVVYMPKGSSQTRLEAIIQYGAEASITTFNYDDTVIHANKMAQETGWILLQDTSWLGYETIPLHIMQGYFTLVTECLSQEQDFWPTHVFVQAGVGSLAAAIFACLCKMPGRPLPVFVVVEPDGAPCLFESQQLNERVRVEGDLPTIMAGLACGEPSHFAWNILSSVTRGFLKCSDDVARRGMKVLGNPLKGDSRIISGESGAVTLGALFEIMSNNELRDIRKELKLSRDSKVLLFSTEGDTDPEVYRDIVW